MDAKKFLASPSDVAPPPNTSVAQQALWWAGKGAWERAHDCVQQREGDPDYPIALWCMRICTGWKVTWQMQPVRPNEAKLLSNLRAVMTRQ
jgi:hypothetical protein